MSETLFDYGVEDTTPKTKTIHKKNEEGHYDYSNPKMNKVVLVKERDLLITGKCSCGDNLSEHYSMTKHGYERFDCEKEGKWYILEIDYEKEIDIKGKVLEEISLDDNHEGCGYMGKPDYPRIVNKKYTLKDVEKIFKAIFDFKDKDLKPYKEHLDKGDWTNSSRLSDSNFYRKIPFKDFNIMIDKSTIKVLKQKGFDFEKWLKEYQSIKEITPSKEYVKELKKGKDIMELNDTLLEQINFLRESIKYKLGKVKSDSYGETKIKKDYFPDSKIDLLYERLKGLKIDMGKLSEEMDKVRINTDTKAHDDFLDIDEIKDIDNLFDNGYTYA